MTRRLILIRHAKSSWGDPGLDDHRRDLNPRGRAAASAIGTWLQDHGYVPDVIVCSDATRTQATAGLISKQLSPQPPLIAERSLYLASPAEIRGVLAKQDAACVAVVGHNPGIGDLANMMVENPPNHLRFADYPTCATTVIELENGLGDKGRCIDFIVPRDLTDG